MFVTVSPEETANLGEKLGRSLRPNSIVALFGDLAAGKTTFVRGVAKGVLGFPKEEVSSPTYTYLNIYPGDPTLYHFDLYRLEDPNHFLDMGFDEYLYQGGVSCLEWSERIESILPGEAIRVQLLHAPSGKRKIRVTR